MKFRTEGFGGEGVSPSKGNKSRGAHMGLNRTGKVGTLN